MSRREYYEEQKMKKIIYVFAIALILSIVLFLTIFVLYNQKKKQKANEGLSNIKQIADIVPNYEEIQETSSSRDLTINSASSKSNIINQNVVRNTVNTMPVTPVIENKVEQEKVENKKKEYSFIPPISGEILKDYAVDTLVYSNTLEEWTTHTGIDIKAPKTSVVVASEEGTVDTIKNDPRFGLTVTIKHGDEFKTVYSNLYTAEFIKEGEEVEKGQTIGTVGDTASFEIADEPHLHFEIYKNGENVNPTIYLKDN